MQLGRCQKCSDSQLILNVQPIRFASGLEVRGEKKRSESGNENLKKIISLKNIQKERLSGVAGNECESQLSLDPRILTWSVISGREEVGHSTSVSLICFAEVEITPGYFWGRGQISKSIYKLDHCVFLTIEAQLDDAIGHSLGKKCLAQASELWFGLNGDGGTLRKMYR